VRKKIYVITAGCESPGLSSSTALTYFAPKEKAPAGKPTGAFEDDAWQ
jgi:hypothetical protein